jgi:hypothetical protein
VDNEIPAPTKPCASCHGTGRVLDEPEIVNEYEFYLKGGGWIRLCHCVVTFEKGQYLATSTAKQLTNHAGYIGYGNTEEEAVRDLKAMMERKLFPNEDRSRA